MLWKQCLIKVPPEGDGGRSETLREPGLGALIKENIRESDSGSDVRDRIRHYKKALGA